jgi:hypothetical protein
MGFNSGFNVIKAAGVPYRSVTSQNQHCFICILHTNKTFYVVYNLYNAHNTPVGPGLAQCPLPVLFSLRYNGMLVTFTAVSFVAKFQPHVLSVYRCCWSSVAIIFRHIIQHVFCFLAT